MQLSAELWKSLLSSIRCEQRKSLPEKRKKPRVQIRARITLIPVDDGEPSDSRYEVWTRDVSMEGISFTSGRSVKTQQQFFIELPRRHGASLCLLAATRQCRKLADGVYAVGLRYLSLDVTQPQPSPAASADAA